MQFRSIKHIIMENRKIRRIPQRNEKHNKSQQERFRTTNTVMGQTTKTFYTNSANAIQGKALITKQTLGDYTTAEVTSEIKGAYFGVIRKTKGITMLERKKD